MVASMCVFLSLFGIFLCLLLSSESGVLHCLVFALPTLKWLPFGGKGCVWACAGSCWDEK